MTDSHSTPAPRPMPVLELPSPRRSAWGLAASVAVHGLLVLLVVGGVIGGAERLRVGGLGDGSAGGGGGGGGSRVSYIELPPVGASAPAAAPVAETPPVVTPPVEAETPVATPVPPPAATAIAAVTEPRADAAATSGVGTGTAGGTDSGSGGGSGGGIGGGVGPGEGPGAGPGSGGDSTGIVAPRPRRLVLPLDTPPKALRGVALTVTFWVTSTGDVEKFDVDPEIEDDKYAEKFAEHMRKLRFYAARTRTGIPVAVVYPMTIELPTR